MPVIRNYHPWVSCVDFNWLLQPQYRCKYLPSSRFLVGDILAYGVFDPTFKPIAIRAKEIWLSQKPNSETTIPFCQLTLSLHFLLRKIFQQDKLRHKYLNPN